MATAALDGAADIIKRVTSKLKIYLIITLPTKRCG